MMIKDKNMKKILSVIMALAAPLAAMAFSGDVVIDGIAYKIVTKSRKATVIPNEEINITGNLVIPSTVTYKDDYEETVCNVVGIEDRAFANQGLYAVSIPASVTYIGQNAFTSNRFLQEVVINGNSLTSIGEGAFATCRNLYRINLPESITIIPKALFNNCQSLWDVNIPSNVTEIGELAFAFCAMSSVTIPSKVKSIGFGAFENCSRLESVVIPSSVTSLGTSVFAGSGLKSLTVPRNIKTIPGYAFHNCNELREVVLSEGVTSIGENAFSESVSLQTVWVPKSLKSVGSDAFRACNGLKEVHIADFASWCQTEFLFEESNPLSLAHHLYRGVEVREAVIPTGPTVVGDYVFNSCYGLLTTTIPSTVSAIGDYAYSSCIRLKRVVIGKGVKDIGSGAFSNCGDLEDVYCYATSVPSISSNTFANSYIEDATLHVPAASVNAYKNNAYWGKFGSIVSIGSNDPIADMRECAKPTVSYKNGKIEFGCTTPGATFVSRITPPNDFGIRLSSEVKLSVKYTVSVYAVCEGYAPSDVSIVEINWLENQSDNTYGDVNGDGAVDVADIATIIDVMAGHGDAATKNRADVNCDGSVDVADIASVIDKMAASSRQSGEDE